MKVIPFYYEDEDDLYANTYLLIDEKNQCIVIDPSKEYDGLINYIKKNQLVLKGIFLTHGHFDHIRGVNHLIETINVPLYIGFEEVDFLYDDKLNCSYYFASPITIDVKPITVSDGEILRILDEDIICIHTPFHTIGCYCYFLRNSKIIFTGDFLFKDSVGRSDLPTGNGRLFPQSIKKIINLGDDVTVYPGHGPKTTIGREKEDNECIKIFKA